MAREHITAIKGADGTHSYKTKVFPLRELVDLQLELGRIMGGAAGPGIDYLSGLFSIDKSGVSLAADPDKKADSRKLGTAIAAIPAGIIEAGGFDFVARILAKTSREVDLGGEQRSLAFEPLNGKHPSGDGSTWMDHLYPGNLGELYSAIGWVLCVNFSPFGRGPSWSWKALWDELSTLIPVQSLPTPSMKPDGSAEPPTPSD